MADEFAKGSDRESATAVQPNAISDLRPERAQGMASARCREITRCESGERLSRETPRLSSAEKRADTVGAVQFEVSKLTRLTCCRWTSPTECVSRRGADLQTQQKVI